MKKLFTLLLAALIGMSLTACGSGSSEKTDSDTPEIVGGWTSPDSLAITDEVKTVLEKATSGLVGAGYEPVAYLGSQVVAGINHRILCKVTPVTKDPEATYAIVTVYEALDGSAEITEVLNSEAKVYVSDAGMDGGWTAPETPAVTEDARKALTGATSELEGAQYNPVALLGTQLVAGTNYCLLCEITPVVPNAESHYAVVIVYDGVDGTTSITDTFDFAAAE